MKEIKKVNKIVLTAILIALIFVTTFLVHIPTGLNGGYIHFGDAFIYLAASILPGGYAMVAAGLGAALADGLSGAAIWIIPTLIIKPIMTMFFTSNNNKIINKQNIIAVFLAGITGVILYGVVDAILSGNIVVAITAAIFGLLQPIGSGIAYVIFGIALDKIKIREKIGIPLNVRQKE